MYSLAPNVVVLSESILIFIREWRIEQILVEIKFTGITNSIIESYKANNFMY